MRYVVTITDNIGQSNMPFHEFACYRYSHLNNEHQIVFVMGNEKNDSKIPDGLDVRHVGTSLVAIKNETNRVLAEAKADDATVVFHVHEAKSVIRLILCMGFKLRSKIVYTVHSTYSGYPTKNKVMAYIAAVLSSVVICVSETSYESFPKSLKNNKAIKVLPVQNGVDIERIDRVKSIEWDNTEDSGLITLVYTARLIPLKDHQRLLKIVSQLPQFRLILLGDGPLKAQLQEMCKRYDIESRVSFYGIRPRDEVFRILKSADAYVSTSTLEGLPISLLEAMTCGLPCFVSDIAQHLEVNKSCPTLECCSTDDEWTTHLKAFAGLSCDQRHRLGEKSRNEVIERFSLKRMHGEYTKVYEHVEV